MEIKSTFGKYFIGFLMEDTHAHFIQSFEEEAKRHLPGKTFIRKSVSHITIKPPFEISESQENLLFEAVGEEYGAVAKKAILVPGDLKWFDGADPNEFFYVLTFKDLVSNFGTDMRTRILNRLEEEFPGSRQNDILGEFHSSLGMFTKDEKRILIQNAFSFPSPSVSKITFLAIFKKIGETWDVVKVY
ncbi:MAG: hypothetical protein JWM20_7 [Patescibacteria group bacterium]|nr:hypothetical protein [Patescibacteria group bacterium]